MLLSFETWKSVEGAVTVISPGAPVRFVPERSNDCDEELFPTIIFPKSGKVVGFAANMGGGTTPVPLTATVIVVAPPPLMLTLPDLKPVDCGVNRTYTGVVGNVADE